MHFFTVSQLTAVVSARAIRLSAMVRAPNVFVTTQLELGSGFVSSPSTPLRVERVRDGEVELVPAERDDVVLLGGNWAPQRVRCDALMLSPAKQGGIEFAVTLDQDTRLLAEPGGEALMLVRKGAHARVSRGFTHLVVGLRDGAAVHGWVPGTLRALESRGGVGVVTGSAICCNVQRPPPRDCSRPLPLLVSNGKRIEPVGELRAGSAFDVLSRDETWVTISPREVFFTLSDGWQLVVPASDLEACSAL